MEEETIKRGHKEWLEFEQRVMNAKDCLGQGLSSLALFKTNYLS